MSKFPKIGIRPTIDGRYGGVRESLEGQTYAMAENAAKFLSANLKYPDGSPVVCVISDGCIGGITEAAACADKFRTENVGVSLTVTPCWCYGAETMDQTPHVPKAVWGFNGTERPGAVYLAAVLAGHTQKGIPAFGIYGKDVQDAGDETVPDDVQEKLLRFARAGLTVAMMKNKTYLSIGGTSMGIVGSIIDPDFFQEYLGMNSQAIDMTEVVRRIEKGIFDEEELALAKEWVSEKCIQGKDYNSEETKRSAEDHTHEWDTSIKMFLICRDLMEGNPKLSEKGFHEEARGWNAICAGFQGQRQWTDNYPNGDFMEAMLTTSFDWNGKRAPYQMATENDALNAVSMLFGNLLTNTAQIFADLRTYWSPEAVERVSGHKLAGDASNGLLHLINSGPATLDGTGQMSDANGNPVMKPHWEISDEEMENCLKETTWHPSITEYFPGGGMSTRYKTKGGMKATILRLNLVKGLGPALQIAEGVTVELPDNVHDALDERTNPTWPTTWFCPRITGEGVFRDTYSVMNNWGANHCVMSFGHIGADLISMASMLRIPVYMHNVEDAKVFRPSSWAAHGTANLEGADFRACENYGPLYK